MSNIVYQWQVSTDGGDTYTDIPHSGSVLELVNLTESNHGEFYRCKLNRPGRNKYRYSQPAKLSVLPDLILSDLPENNTIINGSISLDVTAIATSGASLTYQWQYSNDNINYFDISGATGTSVTINNLGTNNNGWGYRCCVTSSLVQGFYNKKCTNNAIVSSLEVNSNVQIQKQPQNYYGPGNAMFDVSVLSANDNIEYVWQESIDNGQTWHTISNEKILYVDNSLANKYHNAYRVQVSCVGHTVISQSARILPAIRLPDQSSRPSEILGLNTFVFKSIQGAIGTLSNNFGSTNTRWPQEITLLTLRDKQTNTQYDITAKMLPSRTRNRKPLAINDILLYKNNQLIKSANDNYDSLEFTRSNPIIQTDSSGDIYISGSRVTASVVGRNYGRGYCINFSTPIFRLSHTDRSDNYIQIITNAIAKCSSVKFGTIKVAIFSSGTASRDTALLNKLPKKIFVNNGISANANIQYTVLTYSSSLDMHSVLKNCDVLIIDNPYNSSSRARYFDTARQNVILNFINNGGGLITGEWTMYRAARGSFNVLKDAFPVILQSRSSYTRIRSPLRWYAFNQDNIMTSNLENTDYLHNTILRADGGFRRLKSGSEIFYMSEQRYNRNNISLKKSVFQLFDTFTLEAQQKYNTRVVSGNKYYECAFRFNNNITKDYDIGGVLYWSYKSLIEHYREGANTRLSPWNSRSILNGSSIDGFSRILKQYNKSINDFLYPNNTRNDVESININSQFWKDLSRLLSGSKPVRANFTNIAELEPSNYIKIIKQPFISIDTNGINRYITMTAYSALSTPISYQLQYSSDADSGDFIDIESPQFGTLILVPQLSSEMLKNTYRLKLSSQLADDVYSDAFSLEYETIDTALSTSWTPENTVPSLQNSTLLASRNNFQNWQFSFDNTNYYDILNENSVSGDYNVLSINSNNYYSAQIRFRTLHEDYTVFSLPYTNSPIDDSDIFMALNTLNVRFVGNTQYIDLVANIDRYNPNLSIDENSIIWQQYSTDSNNYENIAGVSGNSVLYISGVPHNLVDQYKFRAIVQNRIIYP